LPFNFCLLPSLSLSPWLVFLKEGATMPTILINPFNEAPRTPRQAAPELDSLAGKTIGLLDISKPGGSFFLDHLAQLLQTNYGVEQIVRATKPTFSKPAPEAVIAQLIGARCDAVIEALAD
jgi:hypothetical protein